MNAQAQKALSGINLFPKEHVWIPIGVKKASWDDKRLRMDYTHRPVTNEDKQRRELVLQLLSRDTPADAKTQIQEALNQMRWPCHE